MSSTRIDSASFDHSASRTAASDRDADAARRAAREFEALLLSQFTAALNPSNDDEEEGIFGSGGTDLYRQMFSEQMAKTLANSGGVGLADKVMEQLGKISPKLGAHAGVAQRAIDSARLVRSGGDGITPADQAHQAHQAHRAHLADQAGSHSHHHLIEKSHRVAARSPLNAHHSAGAAIGAASAANMAATSANSAASAKDEDEIDIHLPLEGRISSRFGMRRDPIHGHHRRHSGIDIAAARGTVIAAAAPGKVVFAGRRGGYGNLVEIEHADGRHTRYGHADQLLVAPGDEVIDGQPIATVGSTGRSTGPHLHFEVMENGQKVNPLEALTKDVTLTRR